MFAPPFPVCIGLLFQAKGYLKQQADTAEQPACGRGFSKAPLAALLR